MERIAPLELEGRDAELAELAEFCTSPETAGTYAWWRAPAWSGKSALMSWFVLHPPRNVRIVSFFVTARLASQNDRDAFIDNVLEQLLAMLGEALPPFLTESTRDAHLLGLLDEAAEACHERGEEFVLLVDGLDEDRGVGNGPDSHSIAALLPAQPHSGMRVVVAGRPNPPIPGEVPAHHPLRDESIVRPLEPSLKAQALREEMERDLLRLLEGTGGEQDLLGLVTAAGGGLSSSDLAELMGWSQWEINRRLRTVAGRSFSMRGSEFQPGRPEVFLLGHEQLQVTALDMFGPARLTEYRERLHTWAQQYRVRRWPDDTPEYLLRGYFRMLNATGDLNNMVALATDPYRQNRMLNLSGGDALALYEITAVLNDIAEQGNPDLTTVLRLAIHRDHLSDRNSNMPTEVPAAWARIGQFHRAESLSDSLPTDSTRMTALVAVAGAVAEAGEHQRAHEVLDRAEAIARTIADPNEQAQALAAVAEAVTKAGEHHRAHEVLDRAEAIARTIADPNEQAEALAAVAGAVTKAGEHQRACELLAQAEATARTIRDDNSQGAALSSVARAVAETGDCQWAEAIAHSISESISGSDWRAYALGFVAGAVARAGDHQRGETIAHSIAAARGRAQALTQVAGAIANTESKQRAHELFEQAETIAHSITDGRPLEPDPATRIDREHTLLLLAEAVAEAGEYQWAETIARSITEIARQSHALRSVAENVAKTGDYQWAETIASSIASAEDQAVALVAAANAAADTGKRQRAREILEQAEAIARTITDPYGLRARAFMSIARAVAEVGDHQQAHEFLRRAETQTRLLGDLGELFLLVPLVDAIAATGDFRWAETVARSITAPDRRAEALQSLAGVVAEAGDHQGAEAIAGSITDPGGQASALGAVARAAARAGDHKRAETIAHSLTEPICQVETWAILVETMAEAGNHRQARKLLEQAETTTRSIADPYWQVWALIDVARAVASMGDGLRAPQVLEDAEKIAHTITDSDQKAWALINIAQDYANLGDSLRAREVLEDAEKVARSISEPNDQEHALTAVATGIAETGDHHRAETAVRSITAPLRQASALAQVAEAIAQAGELQQAETIARSLTVPFLQARALAAVTATAARTGNHQQNHSARIIVDALRLSHWHHSVEGLITIFPAAGETITTELEILDGA
ncbi:tetratricopeptide repeat protein [Spirillospora sp. CA-255316]